MTRRLFIFMWAGVLGCGVRRPAPSPISPLVCDNPDSLLDRDVLGS